MTGKTLLTLGWPGGPLIGMGLKAAETLMTDSVTENFVLERLEQVRSLPQSFINDPLLGAVAREWLRLTAPQRNAEAGRLRETPIPFARWGESLIDSNAIEQMSNAARLPIARAGALMPDAHHGYGLPVGGVLATEGAIIPYAVGVDIACRMRLTVFDASPHLLEQKHKKFEKALLEETRFGVGSSREANERPEHPVLDDPAWEELRLLRPLKGKAWAQLGTSGSGNHFVEFGILRLGTDEPGLGLKAGKYLALLSHSGSRGVGATIADTFTKIAREQHPKLDRSVEHLAWLDMKSDAGQEYWLAMNLAGRYAAANHAVIHELLTQALRLEALAVIENHHNFCWEETLPDGTPVYVHRKGATPAGAGVLGVIPGSMGDPGYVVRGLGNPDALNSASHGAGRRLGRREAKRKLDPKLWQKYLKDRNITLLGGSLDEAPQAYKSINDVMAAQSDLVEIVASFTPRLVRMAEESGAF
ncbi:MAG: RtcB family protein [Ardenticatenales bacterium]|nr:RtcB family protein [Ardenticatenales bacterium]